MTKLIIQIEEKCLNKEQNDFILEGKEKGKKGDDFQIDVEESSDTDDLNFRNDIERIAVVGALSFLGYKLCKLFLERGKSVVMGVGDNLDKEDEDLIQNLVTEYPEERVRLVTFSYLEMSSSIEMLDGCQALVHCGRGSRM